MQETAAPLAPRALARNDDQDEAASLLRALPPEIAEEGAGTRAWERSPLARLSDAALVSAVARAIAPPKADADTSFLTHAPLELLARAALMSHVGPEARGEGRRRIAAIAAAYARAGEEIEARPMDYAHEDAAIAAARGALDAGDAEALDAALIYLASRISPHQLRAAFAEPIAPELGAAGHAPILFAEFARVAGRLEGVGALLRAPARAIARLREGRLTWQERCKAAPVAGDSAGELMRRLARAPRVVSSSPYIAPTMQAVEAGGLADKALGDVTAELSAAGAARALARVAAQSMLQDDMASAPYGWTHALTMPLAVLGNVDVATDETALVRVAATHALGFRATMGSVALDLDYAPPRPRAPDIFAVEPIAAAGAAYHADRRERAVLWSRLATRCARMEDAHLAKYTVAALDAAGADPEGAPLYLAAAAFLGAWWDAHPDAAFEG
jgi:hypothetical protein